LSAAPSPVSHPVSVRRLPAKGLELELEADEAARAALAAAHGLLSVESFHADLTIRDWKRDGVSISGRVTARIVQACVTTLEPLTAVIDEPVDGVFLPSTSKLARFEPDPSGEVLLDPDGPDAPEVFEGDTIDVGAFAEECFAVAIDPYPRKPGASEQAWQDEAEPPLGPLAEKLAALKARS
jgi:hypothetical protein